MLNKNKTRLINSRKFVELAKTWNISRAKVQISYDVVNLYRSVPTKEATDIIINMLNNDPELISRTKLSLIEIKKTNGLMLVGLLLHL